MVLVSAAATPVAGQDFAAAVRALDARDAERRQAANAEDAARLTLEWLRALNTAVGLAPERRDLPAELMRYEGTLTYNEIGGSWFVDYGEVMVLHEKYRATTSSDDLAWFAAGLPLGGECEGYIPCYMSTVNTRHGEYLRRHPRGRHAGEAMGEIVRTIRSMEELIASYPDIFTPKSDCQDLMAVLAELEDAVQNAEAREQAATSELIHQLASRCEPPRLE